MLGTVKNRFRDSFTYLPKLGLKRKADFHEDGVTFVVPVKDEERWIGPCLTSIAEVADEIIVIDSSLEDASSDITASMAESNNKINHIRFYCPGPHAFALSCHIGLVNANYRWVFKWDSDMVAKSAEALWVWKDRLSHLDKKSYYVVDVPRVNLEGDLNHQNRKYPLEGQHARIFTWSPELRWALKPNYYEQVTGDSIWGHRFPPWYKVLHWNEPYIYHCNVKSPMRLIMRQFNMDYMAKKEVNYPTLEGYTEYRVKKDWHMTLAEAEQMIRDEQKVTLIPYDFARFGELPEILKTKVPKLAISVEAQENEVQTLPA